MFSSFMVCPPVCIADDNVHFQNSALLSKYMIRHGVNNIQTVSFAADENHSYNLTPGGSDGYYRYMTRAVEDCLGIVYKRELRIFK